MKKLIHQITQVREVVPVLFKKRQFEVLKKLDQHTQLTETEQRYLRGNIRKKLSALEHLVCTNNMFQHLLTTTGGHITGMAALKAHGYGWFFEPKIIEVINTKIEGMLVIEGKQVKFVRVKSVRNSKTKKIQQLLYATTAQILKDTQYTKNNYTRQVWREMQQRYGILFCRKSLLPPINYAEYGV